MRAQLRRIAAAFGLRGSLAAAAPLSGGRVNETWRVRLLAEEGARDYVFQRLSETAFPAPAQVMENIARVSAHLTERGVPVQSYRRTPEGQSLVRMEGLWRVTDFVPGRTFSAPETPQQLAETGRAFGHFLRSLADFDSSTLHATIPEFHNTRLRLDALFAHAQEADAARQEGAAPLLGRLSALRESASAVYDRCREALPLRVTHNDTKCSNVLFCPDTDRFRMVIDLDTVMPGYAVYDFGDAVRSACTTPDGRALCPERLAQFRAGYLAGAGDCLTPEEEALLLPAAFAVTTELAARYCDDWLTGAGYFRTGTHLERAAQLLALAESMGR